MPIRRWRPQDLAATIETFQRAVHKTAAAYYTAEQIRAWAPEPPDTEHWHQRLVNSNAWICEISNRLAGFISSDAPGHIDLLFVNPDYLRTGVATALIKICTDDARARGIGTLVTEASLAAVPFFESHGFVVLRAQTVARHGVTLQNFVMERVLEKHRPH